MDAITIAYIVSGGLILVAVIFGIVAQSSIDSNYRKFSKIIAKNGMTGGELASYIMKNKTLDVTVNSIKGRLTDYYDPRNKSVNISSENFNSASISALGVVAHEFGHALQDQEGYKPFKIRQTVVKVSGFVSKAFFPIVLLGFLFNFAYIGGIIGTVLIGCALAFYASTLIANLATLPVEIDASKRAMRCLEDLGVLNNEELEGARKVLKSAAMTYVASLLMAFVYFLRFLLYTILITRDD